MSLPRTIILALAASGAAALMAAGLTGCGDSTASTSSVATTGAPANAEMVSSEVQDEPDDHTGKWSYSGATGPSHWATLSPDYAACDGTAQTPIDITQPPSSNQAPPDVAYVDGTADVFNNGHTVEAAAATGSTVTANGTTSNLVQMHFHAPSEHTVNGRHAPAEVHFVNQSADGTLTVIGAMVQVGAAGNADWAPFIDAAGAKVDDVTHATMAWSSMLPSDLSSTRYSGSLTTPPCSEGVNWIVLTTPIELSQAQLDGLLAAYDHNSRPVQALNGREVVAAAGTVK